MKKAIATFGLLTLVMILTSFTAPQTVNSSDSTENNMYTAGRERKSQSLYTAGRERKSQSLYTAGRERKSQN